MNEFEGATIFIKYYEGILLILDQYFKDNASDAEFTQTIELFK